MASATYQAASHWIVAVPNELGSANAILSRFASAMNQSGGRLPADIATLEIPSMKVGTLDSLMALADDLSKADAYVEGVVRKVERQVADSYHAFKQAESAKAGAGSHSANARIDPLPYTVGQVPVARWIKTFRWDSEQFDPREPLPELLKRLVGGAEKVDADMRSYSAVYQEKKTALVNLERKRGGNLMVTSLDDVITPQALEKAGAEWISPTSEFLQSVVFVLNKQQEEQFLATYETLDGQSVPLGPEGSREAARGSPVVPRSAKRIAEDKDGYVLYVVTILKKFADSFRVAARDKRFVIRDFTYEPSLAGAGAQQAAALEVEVAASLAHLREQAQRKYGEAMTLWLHVKAVRVFVECVLRYGLPVNFVAAQFQVIKGQHKKLMEAVQAAWRSISGAQGGFLDEAYGAGSEGKSAEADLAIPGVSETSGAPSFPFVFFDFDVRNDTAASSNK